MRRVMLVMGALCALTLTYRAAAGSDEIKGTIKSVDPSHESVVVQDDGKGVEVALEINPDSKVNADEGSQLSFAQLRPGQHVSVRNAKVIVPPARSTSEPSTGRGVLAELLHNIRHNLFKPLLLFFYLGFLVPLLRVKFEFPYVIYQGLTIYLLIAIGWHGGEELAQLDPRSLGSVAGFMAVGFCTNFVIGMLAYVGLKLMTKMRRIDRATVAGYYGSDSAGTFVTCVGVLASINALYDKFMPVMLAVMEIPGCLVALYIVSKLRAKGMDPAGNMRDEPGYDPKAPAPISLSDEHGGHGNGKSADQIEAEAALEKREGGDSDEPAKKGGGLSLALLHEVFLNPGLYLLLGGIIVGFISRLQGEEVTRADDNFFVNLFQGVLCLFLLEMGMTASRKLRDLKTAGPGFIVFGLLAPNVFATIGIAVAHCYAILTHTHFELGTYVLFSVLCAAASYIAVPAVQRMAIPEASPTLPLAASLGLTFTYNVTIGISVYIEIAKLFMRTWPVG